MLQIFLKKLERQNFQNQTIFQLYIMTINQNILEILRTFLNLQKKKTMKISIPSKLSQLLLLNF